MSFLDPIITHLLPIQHKDDMQGLSLHVTAYYDWGQMALPKDAKPDFYAHVSGDVASGEAGLETKDMWSETILTVAAGGSTTATTITASPFYLSRHPLVYERLASEIRGSFSGKDIKQGPQLSTCRSAFSRPKSVFLPKKSTFLRGGGFKYHLGTVPSSKTTPKRL